MIRTARYAFLISIALCLAHRAEALAPAAAASGRDVLARYGASVINIEVVASVSLNAPGGSRPPQEQRREVQGTVVSADGLTVVSLSTLNPFAGIASTIFRAQHIEVGEVQYKQVRFQFPDGKEVSARVVLKDPDLDLAYIAPVADAAAPKRIYSPVPLDRQAEAVVLADYYVISRASKALHQIALVAPTTLEGIVSKPRKQFLPTNALPGCPVFDGSGALLGVCLAHVQGGRPSGRILVAPCATVSGELEQARAEAAKPPPEAEPTDDLRPEKSEKPEKLPGAAPKPATEPAEQP